MLYPTPIHTYCHISPRFCGIDSHLSTLLRGKGKHKYPCISYRICPSFGVILHLLGGPLPKDCSTEQYEGGKVTTTGCIYPSERVAKTKGYPDDGIPLTIESRE